MHVPFSKLNNDELYALALRTDEIIIPRPIGEMGIQLYYDAFKEAYDKFEKGKQHESISAKKVSLADGSRDDAYLGFEGHLKNYLYFPDEEIKKKIKELLAKMAKFGTRVTRRKYKEETAIILNLINIVENGFMDLMVKTNTDVWFNLLKETQSGFEKTLRDHTKAQSEDDVESASSIRPELVNSMRNMFTFMPLHYKITQNKDLGEIIKQLEVELRRF